jgi:hypothetical protein
MLSYYLLILILLIILIYIVYYYLPHKYDPFIANSNIPLPSINFNYLSDPNYTSNTLNRYYINPDPSWKWGRRRYGTISHPYRYTNTPDGENYYYGRNYNRWGISNSDNVYNATGIRV